MLLLCCVCSKLYNRASRDSNFRTFFGKKWLENIYDQPISGRLPHKNMKSINESNWKTSNQNKHASKPKAQLLELWSIKQIIYCYGKSGFPRLQLFTLCKLHSVPLGCLDFHAPMIWSNFFSCYIFLGIITHRGLDVSRRPWSWDTQYHVFQSLLFVKLTNISWFFRHRDFFFRRSLVLFCWLKQGWFIFLNLYL